MTPQTIGIILLVAFVVAWYFGQVPLQKRPESRTKQRYTKERKQGEVE